jgi:hypothetical protein
VSEATAELMFGEWLPDLPFYNNPGLVEAQNCVPVDASYKPFLDISTNGDALAAAPLGAVSVIASTGAIEIYAGTATKLYEQSGTSWTDKSGAAYTTADYWRFIQFDDLVIGTNYTDVPQSKTIGSGSNFAALATTGTAPFARQIGKINRFVFLGDTNDGVNGVVPSRVQWSAIDDATNWPTPNTAAARTVQSGEQFLDASYGAVTGFMAGQFWGLVFQQRGISRFTYVGGDIVFQVDTFETSRGCWAPQSLIQVGNMAYFLAVDGWYVTDGQSVTPIGDQKFDNWFLLLLDQTYRNKVTAGIDWSSKCIYWSFPSTSANGTPDRVLIYSILRNRAAWANSSVQMIFPSYTTGYTLDTLDTLSTSIDALTITLDSTFYQGGTPTIMGFSSSKIGTFSGSVLNATIETGEQSLDDGYVYIGGVRPLVTGNPTSVSVQLATRNAQDNEDRAFGTASTRTARTGVCDFRTSGRYVSARILLQGPFTRAMGMKVLTDAGDGV